MSEANKAVIRRLVDEVINRRRFDLLDELCAPQIERRLKRAFTEFASAFPDWRQETVDLVAEGDRVVVRFTCSGTQQASFTGYPATGRRMERVDEVFFFRLQNGRVASLWSLEDTWDRLQQLGHVA
jgi:steroid delta-isomerase-like uncharacterized protein